MFSNTKRKTLPLVAVFFLFLFILPPSLHGKDPEISFALYDQVEDRILEGSNIEEIVAIASISKLMVADLIFDALHQGTMQKDWELTYTQEETSLYGSDVPLQPGHKITVEEALNLLLVRSANSSALLLAKAHSGTEEAFVKAMNQRAKELGMEHTRFINSHGLPILSTDDQNTSTIQDLILLVKHLLQHYPEVLEYTKKPQYTLERYVVTVTNTNPLLREKTYPTLDGLKTGTTTKAGKCLIATLTQEAEGREGQRRIVSFVLGAKTDGERLKKTKELLDFGLQSFRWKRVLSPEKIYPRQLDPILFEQSTIQTAVRSPMDLVLDLRKNYKLKREFYAMPEETIQEGDTLGQMLLLEDGKVVYQMELVAKETVEKSGFFKRLWKKLKGIV